jgi:hypothetical protein
MTEGRAGVGFLAYFVHHSTRSPLSGLRMKAPKFVKEVCVIMAEPQHHMPEQAPSSMRQVGETMEKGASRMEEAPRQVGESTSMDAVMRGMSAVPSMVYYGGMAGSIAASLALFLLGRRWTSLFVGLWAPTIMNLGLMNKMQRNLTEHQPQ